MGFRTVVVLFNDQASEWENDPSLGKKISHAKNFATGRSLGWVRMILGMAALLNAPTQILKHWRFLTATI